MILQGGPFQNASSPECTGELVKTAPVDCQDLHGVFLRALQMGFDAAA